MNAIVYENSIPHASSFSDRAAKTSWNKVHFLSETIAEFGTQHREEMHTGQSACATHFCRADVRPYANSAVGRGPPLLRAAVSPEKQRAREESRALDAILYKKSIPHASSFSARAAKIL